MTGGQVKLQANSFALDISQGALRRAGVDVQAAGALSTDLQYDFARDAQDHQLLIKRLTAPRFIAIPSSDSIAGAIIAPLIALPYGLPMRQQ